MSYSVFERTLARLLSDEQFLMSFLKDPHSAIKGLDLIADERLALLAMDKDELKVTARSFLKKRAHADGHKKKPLWQRFLTFRSSH